MSDTPYHRAALALLTGRPARARDIPGALCLLIGAAEQQRRLARQRRQPPPDDLTAMRRWAAGAIHVDEVTP